MDCRWLRKVKFQILIRSKEIEVHITIRGPEGMWDVVLVYHFGQRNRIILESPGFYEKKVNCIRAAKKMAQRLGVEYREVK